MTTTTAEAADRLSRRRVRMLTVMVIYLCVQQAVVAVHPTRTVELVALFGWLFLAGAILFVLHTGGALLRSPALRRLADDEVTRANRASAYAWGFTAAMSGAIVMSVVAALTETPVLVALRIVILLGIFTAIVRFVTLERRALA